MTSLIIQVRRLHNYTAERTFVLSRKKNGNCHLGELRSSDIYWWGAAAGGRADKETFELISMFSRSFENHLSLIIVRSLLHITLVFRRRWLNNIRLSIPLRNNVRVNCFGCKYLTFMTWRPQKRSHDTRDVYLWNQSLGMHEKKRRDSFTPSASMTSRVDSVERSSSWNHFGGDCTERVNEFSSIWNSMTTIPHRL